MYQIWQIAIGCKNYKHGELDAPDPLFKRTAWPHPLERAG